MSEQHLFKFQQENDYNIAKRNHLILPNISTVVESGNTYINSDFSTKENAEAGDIIVYHEEEDGSKTVRYMKPEAYDKDNGYWTAEAIVVVPFAHTGDGTVRAMALNYASLSTPSEGGDGEAIMSGASIEGSTLNTYGNFTTFSSYQEQTADSTIGMSVYGNAASDSFETSKNNPFDKETYFSEEASDSFLSSPYNNDGTMNEAYHSTGSFEEFTANPLQDMDGKKNTDKILKLAEAEDIYAQTISNVATSYPAAIACSRYGSVLKPCVFDSNKTIIENLATMPWYQPSLGEIGYYMARKGRIDYALEQVGKELSEETVKISTSTFGQEPANVAGLQTDGNVAYFDGNTENMFAIPFCKF